MAGHGLSPWGPKRPAVATRLSSLVLVVAVVVAMTVACSGDSQSLNRGQTEAAIKKAVVDNLTVAVSSVQCPSGIELDGGRATECEAVLSGGRRLRVQAQNTPGKSKSELQVVVLDAAVTAKDLEADLRTRLAGRFGRTFTVTCEKKGQFVVAVGRTIRCWANDGKGPRTVKVKITSASGGFTADVD